MVAYSFKSSFLPAIASREKRQTIRLPRKRHARAGEQLQLFTGPRMRPVRLGSALCVAARSVRLDFTENRVELDDFEVIEDFDALQDFAIRDGFSPPERFSCSPWEYMARWWALTHPSQEVFRGVLIDWGDSFRVASATADAGDAS